METIGKFSSEPCEVALGSTVLRLEVPALCPVEDLGAVTLNPYKP